MNAALLCLRVFQGWMHSHIDAVEQNEKKIATWL